MTKPTREWLEAWALGSDAVTDEDATCDWSSETLLARAFPDQYKPKRKNRSGWTCKYNGKIYNHCIFWAMWDDDERIYIDGTATQFGATLPKVLIGTRAEIEAALGAANGVSELEHVSDHGVLSGQTHMISGFLDELYEANGEGNVPPLIAHQRQAEAPTANSSRLAKVFQTMKRKFKSRRQKKQGK